MTKEEYKDLIIDAVKTLKIDYEDFIGYTFFPLSFPINSSEYAFIKGFLVSYKKISQNSFNSLNSFDFFVLNLIKFSPSISDSKLKFSSNKSDEINILW